MSQVRDHELRTFFTYVIQVLEKIDVPCMVVGGFAAIFYGEPRFTIDVDLVADIQPRHIKPFMDAFPVPEYYASEEGIRDALLRCYPFNVIQSSTGAKIDIVPLPKDIFTRLAFQRRQRIEYDEAGHTADFITAEDIVIAKLMAYRETKSDKHWRDARGVLAMQWGELNLDAIRRGANGAGMLKEFEILLETVRKDLEEQ